MMLSTRHQLFALMLGLGAANALARPVLVAARDEGFMAVANGFGVSFVIWLSLGWALWALVHAPGEQPRKTDYAVAGVFGLSLLIPVATVSWLVTGLVALYWMNRGTTATIAASACAVVAFAALRDPLASLVLKLLATPLLDFDAVLVAHVMGWISEGAERAGNMIYAADNHQLLILTGCTSYTNMSIALLGWFTISKATLGDNGRIQWILGLYVALTIFAINIGRLAIMGLGPAAYTFMHDSHGAPISETLMMVATVLISLWGNRHGTSTQFLFRRA